MAEKTLPRTNRIGALPKGTQPPRPAGEPPNKRSSLGTTTKRGKQGTEHKIELGAAGTSVPRGSKVPKNAKGGVAVSEEEIEAAFKFLDLQNSGRITMHSLKKRLSVIYKGLPPAQYKLLLGEKSEMSLKDLKELLMDNTVENFDPVAEAFKVYDPEDCGCILPSTLRDIFHGLDLAKLSDEDLSILLDAADLDKDGRIGLEDFRQLSDAAMLQNEQVAREQEATAKKLATMEKRKKAALDKANGVVSKEEKEGDGEVEEGDWRNSP